MILYSSMIALAVSLSLVTSFSLPRNSNNFIDLVAVLLPTAQYCSSEKLMLECGGRESAPGGGTAVILIRSALYGRMSAGKCITSTYAEAIGCHADVTSQLEWRCSGRRNCTMLVATFDSITQPCPRDFKSYLEVTYECITGQRNISRRFISFLVISARAF
jgi:Galactose binding lectin domain